MIDKKLESNIKMTEDFMEIWDKFHRIFRNALSQNHVGEEMEKEFHSVRNLITGRYEDLMDSMEIRPIKRVTISRSIYNVLALDKLAIMSDERIRAACEDWHESSVFLDKLLGRLKRKRSRIERFNRIPYEIKKRLKRRRTR